jgi:hypothetical protein
MIISLALSPHYATNPLHIGINLTYLTYAKIFNEKKIVKKNLFIREWGGVGDELTNERMKRRNLYCRVCDNEVHSRENIPT